MSTFAECSRSDYCILWNGNNNATTIIIVTIEILEMASIAQYCIAVVSIL